MAYKAKAESVEKSKLDGEFCDIALIRVHFFTKRKKT
jgi:hypothetical protein